MELTVNDYLTQLDKAKTQTDTTDAAQIQQAATLTKGLQFVIDQLDAGYLARYVWQVAMPSGDSLEVALETNLINIPMQEAMRLDPKLLEGADAKPVNLYLVATGTDLNASGLRIDELAAADELNGSTTALTEKMQAWVTKQLAQTNENRAAKAVE